MRTLTYSALLGLVVGFVLTGCSKPEAHRIQADKTVYEIIDQKWQDDLPGQANYRVSDVPAGPNDLRPDMVPPPSGTVSLAWAVALATANNRDYQLEKENLYISALDLRLVRHAYDLQFFGGGSAAYAKQGDDEAVGVSGNIGFSRLFASGAALTTRVTTAWVDILTGNRSRGLATIWDTAITVPLLRGSGSRVALESLTQAERDTIYQIRSFNHFRRSFVVSVITQYYLVCQQYDFLKNAEWNRQVLESFLENSEVLMRAGRMPGYEFDRIRQEVIAAGVIVIQAERDYRQALDDFKLFLNVPVTAEFRLDEDELAQLRIGRPVLMTPEETADSNSQALAEVSGTVGGGHDQPAENAGQMQSGEPGTAEAWDSVFSETDAIETALLLRLDVANAEDAVADAERKVEVAADSLRAGLNLTGQTRLSTRGGSDSAARIGLDLDLPLDRMAEANDYRKALIVLTQSERAYELARDTATLEVRRAYRSLSKAAQEYAVQKQALDLAQKRYENTLQLLSYGRAGSRRVLDAQEALLNARVEAIEALIEHAIATLEFYRDTGVLLIRPDGMWEL